MSKYDELNKLDDLRKRGTISEEEFQREKSKILNSDHAAGEISGAKDMFGMKEHDFLMLMHLSQFAGIILPLLGFVAPILLWQTNKNNPEVDRHGKNIVNFMISMAVYSIIAGILCFVAIGIPILVVLGILTMLFIILAAVKASQGEYWKYPLSITFLS